MLNVAFTYDYELFLGKNYADPDTVLFTPTKELLRMFADTQTKATWFADVCSVEAFAKAGLDGYILGFEEQLREMVRAEHDVELHIHPHWLSAICDGSGNWTVQPKDYRIHSFGFDDGQESSAVSIIKKGKQYLQSLLRNIDKDYQCIAFRAGGFCIQPERELLKILEDNGIVIDSSVSREMTATNSTHFYDFSKLPNKTSWWISEGSFNCPEGQDRKVFEIAIGSHKNTYSDLLFHYHHRKIPQQPYKGEFIHFPEREPQVKRAGRMARILSYTRTYTMLSLDSVDATILYSTLCEIEHKAKSDPNACVALIGHPKIQSPSSIENTRILINKLKSRPEAFRIVTLRNVYDRVIKEEKNEAKHRPSSGGD